MTRHFAIWVGARRKALREEIGDLRLAVAALEDEAREIDTARRVFEMLSTGNVNPCEPQQLFQPARFPRGSEG